MNNANSMAILNDHYSNQDDTTAERIDHFD